MDEAPLTSTNQDKRTIEPFAADCVPSEKQWQIVLSSLVELGWIEVDETRLESYANRLSCDRNAAHCMQGGVVELCSLRRFLQWFKNEQGCGIRCTSQGFKRMHQITTQGWCVLASWPHSSKAMQKRWLGERIVVTHLRAASVGRRPTVAIASSRLGKYGHHLPNWPFVLDRLLEWISKRGRSLIFVEGTTVANLIAPVLPQLPVPVVHVDWESSDCASEVGSNVSSLANASRWLVNQLKKCENGFVESTSKLVSSTHTYAGNHLSLSPAIEPEDVEFSSLPLQDRIAICLADEVHTLSIRSGGNVSRLLECRLACELRPPATVFVTVLDSEVNGVELLRGRERAHGRVSNASHWLSRGAVGWYAPIRGCEPIEYGCRSVQRSRSFGCVQPCLPYRASWFGDDRHADDPATYLVHCVRGNDGVLPTECATAFTQRVWVAGSLGSDHPMATLQKILLDKVLRAGQTVSRTQARCLCFSSVPLGELVARRSFQSHRGRWDWEPYGLIIRRNALAELGARPVIYGNEQTFADLESVDRPFFQPAQRRRGKLKRDPWSDEHEWRMIGDLQFDRLPTDSLRVFVQTRSQAEHLARRSPWPVIYLKEA